MAYPMTILRKFSDDFLSWHPAPGGPEYESCPFPIWEGQGDLEEERAVLIAGRARKN